jgi:hypothetical protein
MMRYAVAALIGGALALMVTGGGVSQAAPPRCTAAELSATFAQIPGSQGAGQVGYSLTVTNRTAAPCALGGLPELRLLGEHHVQLPTHTNTYPKGPYAVTINAGGWAQARATFTPDIAGRGEPGARCEPVAHAVRLTLAHGGGSLTAPMDATRVCQHGFMSFLRLKTAAVTAGCVSSALTAVFKALGPAYSGQVTYELLLTNTGSPCVLTDTPALALQSAGGGALPTSLHAPVPDPYAIAHGSSATLEVSGLVNPGAHEPTTGLCEPLATQVTVTLPGGGGVLTMPITPPRSFCHRGRLIASGPFLNG